MISSAPVVACTVNLETGPAGPDLAIDADGAADGRDTAGSIPGGSTAFLCDRKAAIDPGPSPLQRLTASQYAATAHELFGDDVKLDDVLPRDAKSGQAGLAQPEPSQVDVENYAAAARRIGEHVETNVQRFAPCAATPDAAAARVCARTFGRGFGTRIYRNPLNDTDVDNLLSVFDVGLKGGGYAHGIGLMVKAMLRAPRFLYRFELGQDAAASDSAVPLTAYELASRLSFAFWNRGPDERLLEAAVSGDLDQPEGIAEQTQRLAADPRAQASMRDFLRVWFGLVDWQAVEKDAAVFPVWSDATRDALRVQSDAFLDAALFGPEGNLDSLFTLDPAEFAPDAMADWKREGAGSAKGLLALPALLTRHSKPSESFPIYRGLFVREQLLCQPLPPPPADVGEPPEPAEGVSGRDRFARHSSDPLCRDCHSRIDPLGFALENYDAIGRFRTTDEGHAIDASGELSGTDADGPFSNLAELSAMLAGSETVRACTTRQWFRFVMQRFEQPADGCSMQTLNEAFSASDQRFTSLRTAIVQTAAFRMRRPIAKEGDRP